MRNQILFLQLVFAGCLFGQQTVIVVPGTSDPWLAGMPNGSTASCGPFGSECDVAPNLSPPAVTGSVIVPGSTLTITATGLECYDPTPTCATGPDGNPSLPISHVNGAENGVSGITAPANALIGVFLGPNQPSLTPPPAQLGSNTAPVLKQVFLIGSSSHITVPAAATRLFLGPMDGFGWYDNYGSFTAQITVDQVSVTAVKMFDSHTLQIDVTAQFSQSPATQKNLAIATTPIGADSNSSIRVTLDSNNCPACSY